MTAAQVLREAQKMNRERELLAVAARFNLDRDVDADMLAAEAYLWIQFMGPSVFWSLPSNREVLDKVGQAVMRYERAHPTTLRRSERNDQQAISDIYRIVDETLSTLGGGAYDDIAVYRNSSVHPALSAHSSRYRSRLGLTTPRWVAHHLIPFSVVAKFPPDIQMAFVNAGWSMDRLENLIALPANLSTYTSVPSPKGPIHDSAHITYSRDVIAHMSIFLLTAKNLPKSVLLQHLSNTESYFRAKLLNMRTIPLGYHPTLP